ncbi:MAG: tRNA (adenosine(37)-N6)-dimethylallyltransferase MiaA [Chloroflexi bacterium]|nr:tRNA (adenosine(37)-N6)-dimethylallyltransferase MiaA [Chloroflexota bacterium]
MVVIVGPTAVGKTALALDLAERFGGEIIGADSRQVYRGMDIGTAKPSADERARIPHHLIDIVAPDEVLSLGQYRDLATRCIAEISARGRLPFMVGGTGQYVKAIVEGWTVPEVAPDMALRAQWEQEAREHGPQMLYARLQAADPVAASRVDARNVRRVIRYLEVCTATGRPVSELQRKEPPPYDMLQIGLTLPRPALYRRIDERVDAMIAGGLVDEVRALLARGYSTDLPSMSSFGYKQIAAYLAGQLTLAQAIESTKKETRRFVQRQYAWFRLDDPNIVWLDADARATMRAGEIVATSLGQV